MKLPRNVDGILLIKLLKKLNYTIVRQKGSHICLSNDKEPPHHITIPNHNPIKIGTLSAILSDIATNNNLDKNKLIDLLFSNY